MVPGEVIVAKGDIKINVDREIIKCKISNNGDRPIQVGSHYHFFEVNDALEFDRKLSRGCRLNIPAGTAIRFEPGQTKQVELIQYKGMRRVFGFQNLVNGDLEDL